MSTMTGNPEPSRRRHARTAARLAGASSLLLGLLSIATNLATSAVPAGLKRLAGDPSFTWGAVVALLTLCVVLAVVDRRIAERYERRFYTNLPARNAAFVGRRAVLRRVRRALAAGAVAVVAVRALGGMGKSQLALEFAHRVYLSGRYPIVWWVRADTQVTLLTDLAELAEVVSAERPADPQKGATSAVVLLGGRDDWLLIFDNARNSEEIRPWLPAGGGRVIITSRSRGWGSIAAQVDLAQFRRRESLRYLRARVTRFDRRAADQLAEALGDLPLALAQAAGYLDLNDLSVGEFLRRYQDRDTAGRLLAQSASAEGYPESVATTWLLHHDQLVQDSPAALDLLRLCSFLDTDDIDLDLVESDGLAHIGDLHPVEGPLIDANLMNRIQDRRVRLHRLVAEATRLHMAADESSPDLLRDWVERVIALLHSLFPQDPGERRAWPRCAELSGHVAIAIEHAEYYGVTSGRVVALAARHSAYVRARKAANTAGAVERRAVSWLHVIFMYWLESLLRRYERSYLRYMASSLAVGVGIIENVDARGLELTETFVPLELTISADAVERLSSDDVLDAPEMVITVIGSAGSGKTTLLRYLAMRSATAPRRRRRIPIIIRVPELSVSMLPASLAEVARRSVSIRANEPRGWWEQALADGRCLVLVDGLDEAYNAQGGSRGIVSWLERQIAAYPLNRYIITSREAGYSNSNMANSRVLRIAPLDQSKVDQFIRKWYVATEVQFEGGPTGQLAALDSAQDLLARIRATPGLDGLARTPLLLTLLANVHRQGGALPSHVEGLYTEIVSNMFRRWSEAHSPSSRAWIGPILAGVAFEMMAQGTDDLPAAHFSDYIEAAPVRPPEVSSEDVLLEAAQIGLVVERREGRFAFIHLTLQEYLAAVHISTNRLAVGELVDGPKWHGTLRFAAQIGDADRIIQACLESGSTEALVLARDCADIAAGLDPSVRDLVGGQGPQ